MDVLILLVVMVLVGLLVGWLASPIWKGWRPIGVGGDYAAAIITAVIVGLMDWFVIPAMGFSETMKYLGVAIEPALGALIVLWIIRQARKDTAR
jgi:uncharacterized membrane protein YeaQ/YmgE (transglycosylase-associated protein family)